MAKSSGRTTAFVPRITFKTALKTVVPACAAAAMTAMAITACGDNGVVALAIAGFDAGSDADAGPDAKADAKGDANLDAHSDPDVQTNPDTGVIVLAVVGFDAAADADADADADGG